MSEKEISQDPPKVSRKRAAPSRKKPSGLKLISERPAIAELIELGRTANRITQSAAYLVAMHTMQERLMLGLLEASDAEVESLRAQQRNFLTFQDEMSEMINRAESLNQSLLTEQEKTIAKRQVELEIQEQWNR